ncbi:FMN-dependent NADH-azoreductase [Chryseobacterium luquanense]|uniref:FMN dependent NADH:quinone oxidoreductase n=1 Tax=Chryseobacterium luquanense TaxID=2983766 RepID=A0ABT3XY72_9FLAO|nr:NAD(P)H-dependent oxidoreductase [Chryseobacterium luquanense]MCX8530825.1 NAD(P)H-dependent oxidoreductase [Chryseobacterium luquanense]
MKQLLHIMSSPNTKSSASRKLGRIVIEKIKEKYSDLQITEYDLALNQPAHLDEDHIEAFFTPAEIQTEAHKQSLVQSDQTIEDLLKADIIVIEAPMYNWNIPSTLKAYFDQIARAKLTFQYTGEGLLPKGLLKDKKAYIVTSSGGKYSEGELEPYDFTTNYVRFFLNLLGIEVVNIFRVEGQAIFGSENALVKAIESVAIDDQL